MSIDHHLHASHKRARRRIVVDVVLVLLFLVALAGIIVSHVVTAKNEENAKLEQQIRSEQVRAKAEADAEAQRARQRDEAEAKDRASTTPVVASDTPPLLTPDTTEADAGSGPILLTASTSADIASDTVQFVKGFVKFDDVTVTRIENKRLGFLMELPEGWSLAYERSDSIAYANSEFYFGVKDIEIAKRDGALWLRVIRPCKTTEATTTVFQFADSGEASTSIREATACVAPFLVTVGYRSDAGDNLGREKFLLSVARTFYPMVSPVAPYEPLR